jgi:hypothetical protein
LLADKSHLFQLLQEVGNVPKEFCARNAEFSFERIRYFIQGFPVFDQLPDHGSNRIQAEAKTLLDIKQHGAVLIYRFPYSLRYSYRCTVSLFWQLLLLLYEHFLASIALLSHQSVCSSTKLSFLGTATTPKRF